VPGSYEPIEGMELYRRIGYEELNELSDEKKLLMVSDIIVKIIGKK
jgi:hypothetical protein